MAAPKKDFKRLIVLCDGEALPLADSEVLPRLTLPHLRYYSGLDSRQHDYLPNECYAHLESYQSRSYSLRWSKGAASHLLPAWCWCRVARR
jgi:hypothetical protein